MSHELSYLGSLVAELAVGFCVTRERNYSSATSPIVRLVRLFFFLVFFVSSALMIFHVGTVLYRDLNGAADALVVKFSRRTVCRI